MKFRPCIDIHNGKVKQIIGGSLKDQGNHAWENFVSSRDAAFFARLYQEKGLKGGHVILLNAAESRYYEADREQAVSAFRAYPGGLQAGGGIGPSNGNFFLKQGASHVIVTSYIFEQGQLKRHKLKEMAKAVGKEHLVLDLSCRKREGEYYIVTDRWQNYTDVKVDSETLSELAEFCDEFLIHGVDVEGKNSGIEAELVEMLGRECGIPCTYAGGVHSFDDLEQIRKLGRGRIDVTVGSALDLFGGNMKFEEVAAFCAKK